MKIASARRAACATRAHRPLHLRAVERIALERDDAAAAARHRLLERGLDHGAVGIVRNERGERALALARPRSRRCDRRRTPAGSSADRRRARRHWRRSRTRSPERRARARPARPALTDCANSGPRMISAPSSSACCAACCAPGALPPSSFTRSWMSGLLNSASAISAALRIDCAATRRHCRCADSGRMSATLTWPAPMLLRRLRRSPAAATPATGRPPKNCPEQPPSRIADASAASQGERRRRWARRPSSPVLLDTRHRDRFSSTASDHAAGQSYAGNRAYCRL